MKWNKLLIAAVLLLSWSGLAYPQASPDANQYVSREEYDKLKQEMDALKADMAAIRKERVAPAAGMDQTREVQSLRSEVTALKQERAAQSAEVNQTLEDLDTQVQAVKKEADKMRIGDTKFLLTGFTHASYIDRRGENSTFDVGFNPVFLWEITDRLAFEGELEFGLSSSAPDELHDSENSTDVSLEYANMTYLVNDYITVGAGRFLVPFGIFNERLHQDWINKLPDRPLIYDDEVGIVQESGTGGFVRGAFPWDNTKFNYALYIDNGPGLITKDSEAAGMLDRDNFTDNNHNKSIGGRLGYLPIPELEVGYSAQAAKVSPQGFENVDMFTQGVDITYKRQVECLRGDIDVRMECVWSHVGTATYDPTGDLGFGPLRFDNNRNGYYIQAAYRPTLADEKILRNFEFVLRYDTLSVPDISPGSSDEHRWTPGIDYWISPSTVVKVAYQFDETSGSQDRNALLLQAAMGF